MNYLCTDRNYQFKLNFGLLLFNKYLYSTKKTVRLEISLNDFLFNKYRLDMMEINQTQCFLFLAYFPVHGM